MSFIATSQHGELLPLKSAERQRFDFQRTVLVAACTSPSILKVSEGLEGIYRVVVAEDLNYAHTLTLQQKPDLVIIDFNTRQADGLQLCYQLKLNSNTNHIPVVLVADSMDPYIRMAGLQYGADDCLAAPLYHDELVWRVRNLIQLCANLKSHNHGHLNGAPGSISPSERSRLLVKIMEVAEKNISNPRFDVALFSKESGLSQIQLYRKIVELTGLSPNEYIRKLRLQRAAELCQSEVGNIGEIAFQVGFSNLSYFSKCFKQFHTCTPSEFIRKAKTTNQPDFSVQRNNSHQNTNLFSGWEPSKIFPNHLI